MEKSYIIVYILAAAAILWLVLAPIYDRIRRGSLAVNHVHKDSTTLDDLLILTDKEGVYIWDSYPLWVRVFRGRLEIRQGVPGKDLKLSWSTDVRSFKEITSGWNPNGDLIEALLRYAEKFMLRTKTIDEI